MQRKIITIDKEKCVGCGQCVSACQEGAIGMVDGKAALLREDYCDGLGNCLPVCPANAISFQAREAVPKNMEERHDGCPGTHAEPTQREDMQTDTQAAMSQLNQWPVQIKLVPVNASYLKNANLLVSADCAAYAYKNFHQDFMRNKITLIACPKLDEGDYSEKLTAIFQSNSVGSVTVARMEVPCCGGIENAVKTALQNCGGNIPCQVMTISTDGRVRD